MTFQKSDVIIIGAGIAGLVAAFECLNRGRNVLVLDRDKAENMGGLAKLSFGGMALVDTPVQRRMGIKDSPEVALKDWHSFAEFEPHDKWPKAWANQYVNDSSNKVYKWLVRHGIKFFPAVNWVERGQYCRGNSLPRYHILWGTGYRLVERFQELLSNHKNSSRLSFQFNQKVIDLIRQDGCITGCRSIDETTGQEKESHAHNTIVATGGIAGCLDKVKHHWPQIYKQAPTEMLNGSHPFADGTLHDAVSEKGGNVTHLDKMWNYAAGIPHPKPQFEHHGLSLIPCKSALWLDHTGKRIGPEPLVTGFDTHALCKRVSEMEKPYTWQVLNWRIAAKELAISGSEHNPSIRDRKLATFLKEVLLGNHRLVRQLQDESDHFIVANDMDQLISKMHALNGDTSIKPGLIYREVLEYDEMIRRGSSQWNDDQLRRIQHARAWHSDKMRTCKPKPILDPNSGPLIAIKVRIITRKSLGGIQTDLQSRVLDLWGEPMQGLYAAGEAAGFGGGGASGLRSLEGTFLSGSILTARAAAESITSAA